MSIVGNNNSYVFEIWVNENLPPDYSGPSDIWQNSTVGEQINWVFSKSYFTDPESQQLYFTISINASDQWITCSENTTDVYWEGQPDSNSYVGYYRIRIIVYDSNSNINNKTKNDNFYVISNQSPSITQNLPHQTIDVPFGHTWTFDLSGITDPEGDALIPSLKVDGSSTIPSWFTYDLSTFVFSILTSSNVISGTHSVEVSVDDTYSLPASQSFSFTIIENPAPIKLKSIPNLISVLGQVAEFQLSSLNELFQDPANEAMVGIVTLADGNNLPTYLTFSNLTNMLTVDGSMVTFAQTFDLKYTATDTSGSSNAIDFRAIVNGKLVKI